MRAQTLRCSLALLLALLACACHRDRPKTPPRVMGGLDEKLSAFAWHEDGSLVNFVVDTRAAGYAEESGYMPLEIAVANRGLDVMTVTRESFTLVDETGQKYPAVGPRELLEGYERLDLDRGRLAELEGIVDARFATFTRYPSRFSPSRASVGFGVRESVSLPKFGYLVDFIYFPRPATGMKDRRFELQLATPELPADNTPIFVKFMVL
jgi:hypothetical protein